MADGDDGPKYTLMVEHGHFKTTSRGHTGKGKAMYPVGDIYDGYFADGIREGRGKYFYLNGDIYDGEWKNNRKHGIGKMVYNGKVEYSITEYGQTLTPVLDALAKWGKKHESRRSDDSIF